MESLFFVLGKKTHVTAHDSAKIVEIRSLSHCCEIHLFSMMWTKVKYITNIFYKRKFFLTFVVEWFKMVWLH